MSRQSTGFVGSLGAMDEGPLTVVAGLATTCTAPDAATASTVGAAHPQSSSHGPSGL